jgi:hypothetical protein
MQTAAISYRNDLLEAREQDDFWTVRLANLEECARYLDLALAKLLGNAPEAHRAATRLLTQLAEVVEQQEAAYPSVATVPLRERRSAPRRNGWARPQLLGLRVLVFAVVASVAFMLTTWLSALR